MRTVMHSRCLHSEVQACSMTHARLQHMHALQNQGQGVCEEESVIPARMS